jgi:hypothetical protein
MSASTKQLMRELQDAISHAIAEGYYDQAEQLQMSLDYLSEAE